MRRVSERAYERCIGSILGLNPETNDVDNPTKVNTKKFPTLKYQPKELSLLKKLNPHKASGPDQLTPIVLQTLHKELALILQVIFQKSIDQAQLPNIWKEANDSPIFKKGDRTDPQEGTLFFFPHT